MWLVVIHAEHHDEMMGLSIFYKYMPMKFYEYEYGYSLNIYEWSPIYPQEYEYEYRGFFVDNILSLDIYVLFKFFLHLFFF